MILERGVNIFEQVMQIIIIIIVIIVVIVGTQFTLRKRAQTLYELLYITKDYEKYFKVSNDWISKFLIGKKQKFSMDITAYEGIGDEEKLLETIDSLFVMKITDVERLNLYHLKMRLYHQRGRINEIDELYQKLCDDYAENDKYSAEIRGMILEIKYLYYVDFLLDISYFEEMKKLADSVDVPVSKGIFALRTAKLSQKKGNERMMKKYQVMAEKNLKGSIFEKDVKEFQNSK